MRSVRIDFAETGMVVHYQAPVQRTRMSPSTVDPALIQLIELAVGHIAQNMEEMDDAGRRRYEDFKKHIAACLERMSPKETTTWNVEMKTDVAGSQKELQEVLERARKAHDQILDLERKGAFSGVYGKAPFPPEAYMAVGNIGPDETFI